MVLLRHAKWIYAIAGSGIAVGVMKYLQPEKKCVQTSWTVNHNPSVKWDYNWDKQDFSSIIKPAKSKDDPSEQNRIKEEKKKLKSTAYRHLMLVNHGQYEDKANNSEDKKLTALGRKQADYVGKRLKEINSKNYPFKIIHSTMSRAIETAEIIRKHLPSDVPVESSDMLQEPILHESTLSDFDPKYEFFQDGARIEAAFRKYFHRAEASQKTLAFYDIIVCHENVIRYFVCRALQIPPEAWLRFSLPHCSITWICICPDGHVIVNAIGDNGFIPKNDMSR